MATAEAHRLANDILEVRITPYGGRIVSVRAPDRNGIRADVVVGFDDPAAYAASGSFNALLGRCANRIAGGRFTLDGATYELPTNDRGATLHGGPNGFGKMTWEVRERGPTRLVLAHVSPDGDQGFPGELTVSATYELTGPTLRLAFRATTTRPTPVNLSCHPYFNLAGHGSALDHEVTLAARAYLPTDANQIPTGEIRAVDDTPFDFRTPATAGARLQAPDRQLEIARGYDHCFVLDNDGRIPGFAARLRDPASGRTVEIATTQPGLQFYTGNNLDGSLIGRAGPIARYDGIALEAQGFPDAIHQPGFPSCVLRPGETYSAIIDTTFGTGA